MRHYLDYEFDVIAGSVGGSGALIQRATTRQPVAFKLDFSSIMVATGRMLCAAHADLIEVAFIVSLADRVAPRFLVADPRQPDDRWSRRMILRLPVRDPDRWRSAVTAGKLGNYLGYLSGDLWDLIFVPRPIKSDEQKLFLTDIPKDASVDLFSGGMDSFLGLVRAASALQGRGSIVATSLVPNGHVHRLQEELLKELRPLLNRDIRWAHLGPIVHGIGLGKDERESSWRTRSFVYCAIGAVVAALCGVSVARINENGIGAINLPMTDDVVASKSTRAAHPRALDLFSALLQAVIDEPVRVENPFLWWTKGEMCAIAKAKSDLATALSKTASCDQFSYHSASDSCGRCVPCLLRLVSLNASGLAVLSNSDSKLIGVSPQRSASSAIHAMAYQAERLRGALGSEMPSQALMEEFPCLVDLVAAEAVHSSPDATMERVRRLYSKYLIEWDQFTRSAELLPIAA